MSLFDSASLVVTPNGVKAGKLYSIKPTDGSGDLSVTRATSATRVNSNELIESVASNVPRLDYSNGSCPSILVEPQRTNLLLRSEEFDNASWSKANVTVTANNTIAPDGNLTADLITATATNGYLYLSNTSIFSSAGGTARAYSVFLKAGTATSVRIYISTVNANQSYFGLFNLALGTATPITSNTNVFIEDYGNGWYRCTVSATIANATYSDLQIGRVVNGLNFYAWGAQLEAGSNATSYIPTTTTSVTRNADVISKTGISDLIGQTEGTLFVDVNYKAESVYKNFFNLGTSTSNYIAMGARSNNKIGMEVLNSGVQVNASSTSTYSTNQRLKIAMTYKLNDFKLYVNGVLQATDTNGTVPAKAEIYLGSYGNGTSQATDGINSAMLWKTALTEQECIELTTI